MEEDLTELVNPRLLHWHPSSAADEKYVRIVLLGRKISGLTYRFGSGLCDDSYRGQPLLALLDTLCNSRESQKIICRRLRIVFRMKGVPCESPSDCAEGEDENDHDRFDAQGRSRMHVNAFEIAYPAFVQGMRLIFPHALERDLESLWSACEGTASGRLTYESLMAKVMRPVPDRRCGSPEPGPAHYNPQFDVVSPRAPAAVVLPQVPEPEVTAGLPSELFINYETAYKAVKSATPGVVFRKRKFNTSWCNPVPPEEAVAVRVGGNSPDAAVAAGSVSSTSLTRKTPRPPPPPANPDAPLVTATTSSPDASGSVALGSGMPVPGTASSKESDSRSPDQVKSAHGSQAGQKLGANLALDAGGHHASSSSPAALQNGSNLFYNDIAPMYLKFLRSKEIQKLMKLAEDDNESDNRPATRSGLMGREKR